MGARPRPLATTKVGISPFLSSAAPAASCSAPRPLSSPGVPLPGALARLNRRFVNPVLMCRVSGRIPPLATVVHNGRRSGRTHRTPVLAFAGGDGWVFALFYGANRDWVANVMAAGQFHIERRGDTIRLDHPRRIDGDAGLRLLPWLLRPALQVLRVEQFLTAVEAPHPG